MSERQRHRVAIVIFAECDGVDERDAASGAEMSLNHLLREGGLLGRTFKTLPSPPRRDGHTWETTIHEVREVGVAARNGYLWTAPTGAAYPREETPDGTA